MKIIIVIRTRNSDSQEKNSTWSCIKASNGFRRAEFKDGKYLYVFDGTDFVNNANDWDYDNINESIIDIVRFKENADLLILFHSSENEKQILWEKLKEKLGSSKDSSGKILVERYSGADTSNSIWTKHISSFCSDSTSSLNEKFIALWNDLWGADSLEKAQALRADILSPLVALDLIQQAEGEGKLENSTNLSDLKKEILQAMKDLHKPLDEFCRGPIECGKLKDQLYQLLAYEDGSSWEKFHKDLKNMAEQMETQIAAI